MLWCTQRSVLAWNLFFFPLLIPEQFFPARTFHKVLWGNMQRAFSMPFYFSQRCVVIIFCVIYCSEPARMAFNLNRISIKAYSFLLASCCLSYTHITRLSPMLHVKVMDTIHEKICTAEAADGLEIRGFFFFLNGN